LARNNHSTRNSNPSEQAILCLNGVKNSRAEILSNSHRRTFFLNGKNGPLEKSRLGI
jgi:hypothetical protein